MHNFYLEIAARFAALVLIFFVPLLWLTYTERFQRLPSMKQLASVFALVVVIGVLLALPAVTIVAATVLLALGIAKASAYYALAGVHYQRHLQISRLMPDDDTELSIELENRKILPVTWLSVADEIGFTTTTSRADLRNLLSFSGGVERMEAGTYALINETAIAPFQSVRRTYRIKGLHRGVYTLGPAVIESGDPFGLFPKRQTIANRMEIVVYPRVYAPEEIGLPFREALGARLRRTALFEDPTLLAGSREYRPGDPFQRIHWKATARTGELQVRVHDPSTTAQLMIVLNLNSFQRYWEGTDPERMEAAISVAASMALQGLNNNFAVGLRSNGLLRGASTTERIAPSANPRQASVLLEHLARLNFSGGFSAEYILVDEGRRLPAGATILFITGIITTPLVRALSSRQLKGRVSVIYCGRHAAPVVPGLMIHLAAPPAEAYRAAS